MKKILLSTLALGLAVFAANAQDGVLLEETFETGIAGDSVSTAGWTTTGSRAATDYRIIDGTPLEYSDASGTYILSNVGKSMTNYYHSGQSAYTYISYKQLPATQNSGVVYLSYLINTGIAQSQQGSELPGLSNASNGSAVRPWFGRIDTETNGNPFKVGVTRSSGTNAQISWYKDGNDTPVNMYPNTTYFIVIKYDFETKQASLFVNPTIGETDEPTASCVSLSNETGTVRNSLAYLLLRNTATSRSNFKVSGMRVTTTWARAVEAKSTAPQLSAPVVGSATTPTMESFVANWSAVENAVGYTVKVYNGINTVSTADVEADVTSLKITELYPNTAYTYTVIAKGDGTTKSDSDESAASASVTTLDALTVLETDLNDGTWGEVIDTPSSNLPGAGAYPTWEANGYTMHNAVVFGQGYTDPRGNALVNSLTIEGRSVSLSRYPYIETPYVKTVGQVEIMLAAGTSGNGIELRYKTTGGWVSEGVYNTTGANNELNTFIIPVSGDEPIKFRIYNNSTGRLNIAKITTRVTNPQLLDAPTMPSAEEIVVSETGFTAQWSAVEGATGYVINVYNKGETAIVKTIDVPANGGLRAALASMMSYPVTGLTASTEYDYRVMATGDGFNSYADSYLSDPVTVKTADITTSIGEENQADKGKVVLEKFYNLNGVEISEPTDRGTYIKRSVYENGSVETSKIIK